MESADRNVVLPGEEYVLRDWTVRPGSAVRSGDTIATAVRRDSLGDPTSLPVPPPTSISSTKHKRPTLKSSSKRKVEEMIIPDSSKLGGNNGSQAITVAAVPIVAPASGILQIESGDISSLIIGRIEPCLHPAIMGLLCAVCGNPVGMPQQHEPRDTTTTSTTLAADEPKTTMAQVTVSGGITMTVSESEALQMSLHSSQKLKEQKKLSLVLDLDHTLVHATADPRSRAHIGRDDVRTLILPTMEDPAAPNNSWMLHYIKIRPHVKEFFEQLLPLYEISVYTAGTRMYAEQITMVLSRCVKGTTKDDEDIQRLRHEVAIAKQELDRKHQATEKEPEDARLAGDEAWRPGELTTNGDAGKPDESEDHSLTLANAKEEATRKRKRVSFGELPPESKTDETTTAELDSMEKELEEAEESDREALALRQKLFGSRIVSRTDVGDLGRDVKSLKRVFPCGGTMAVILDDREDVWANAKDNDDVSKGEPPENLLLVRPYHWKPFVGFADVNNPAGQDLSEMQLGESDTSDMETDENDMQLLWSVDILKRIHERFYSQSSDLSSPIPVAQLLKDMRRQVLRDCTLVLSGLVPLHKQNRDGQSPRPAAVRYAETLGAQVSDTVHEKVTHVVATRDGTDKTKRARSIPGCVIVKALWLMECYWSITKRNVQPHLMAASTAIAPNGNSSSSASEAKAIALPQQLENAAIAGGEQSSTTSSDSDDDFAAELEAEMMG